MLKLKLTVMEKYFRDKSLNLTITIYLKSIEKKHFTEYIIRHTVLKQPNNFEEKK